MNKNMLLQNGLDGEISPMARINIMMNKSNDSMAKVNAALRKYIEVLKSVTSKEDMKPLNSMTRALNRIDKNLKPDITKQ